MEQDHGRVPAAPGSHPSGHAGCAVDGASRFDPSREGMTNAKLLSIVTDLQRQLGCEAAALAHGTWNPNFCAADASQRALRIFAEAREKLDHWEAFTHSGEAGGGWIEHSGSHCPVPRGYLIDGIRYRQGGTHTWGDNYPVASSFKWEDVIAYRCARKPASDRDRHPEGDETPAAAQLSEAR